MWDGGLAAARIPGYPRFRKFATIQNVNEVRLCPGTENCEHFREEFRAISNLHSDDISHALRTHWGRGIL